MNKACKSSNWYSTLAPPWNVSEECDAAWRDHLISSRYWVICRFCRNWFCHFHHPPCAPEEKVVWRRARRVRVEFRISLFLENVAKLKKMRGGRQTSRVRVSVFFVVLPSWRDRRVWNPGFYFLNDCPTKITGGTDCVWGCFWHRSTSPIWVFNYSNLTIILWISFFWQSVIEFC